MSRHFNKILILLVIITLITTSTYKVSDNKTLLNYNDDLDAPVTPMINDTTSYMIDENLITILDKYPEFKNIVNGTSIPIPVENRFIPQGITLVDDYYLIVGYYENHSNSKCYVINTLGDIINIVELDTNSHVGSIAYDEKRNLLWIPGEDGLLYAYNKSDFFNKSNVKFKYRFDYVSIGLLDFEDSGKNLIAYLCLDDDYLYIGSFFKETDCLVKKYKINFTYKGLDLKHDGNFYVPKRTQSIEFVKYENKKYMILSQSYGRFIPSHLYVYEYDNEITNYTNNELISMELPPMLEQISFSDANIYLLFESNAKKYFNSVEKIKQVISFNFFNLIDNKNID